MKKFISESGVDEIIRENSDGSMEMVGARCRNCGHVIFPALKNCIRCCGNDVEAVILAKEGTIYTYTQTMRPVNHMPAGTITGFIDLDDGVRIFAPIDVDEESKPKIGSRVKMVFRTLWKKDDSEVIGYAAKQIGEEEK